MLWPQHALAQTPQYAAADIETVVPGWQKLSICGKENLPFNEADVRRARFVILQGGRLGVVDQGTERLAFAFPMATASAIARVEVQQALGTKPKVVACGPVAKGRGYVVGDSAVEDGAILTVRLFDTVNEGHSSLAEARKRALLDALAFERDAVRKQPSVTSLVVKSSNLLKKGVLRTPAASNEAFDEVQDATRAAITRMTDLQSAWCLNTHAILAPAICEEAGNIAVAATQIEALLGRARQLPDPVEQLLKLHADGFATSIGLVKPQLAPNEDTCQSVAQMRWLHTAGAIRLAERAEIPSVPVGFLLPTHYAVAGPVVTGLDTEP